MQKFCAENGLVYVTPVVACKNKAKSFEKMKQAVAFFGEELSSIELNPVLKGLPTLDEMLSSRVTDYSHKKIG